MRPSELTSAALRRLRAASLDDATIAAELLNAFRGDALTASGDCHDDLHRFAWLLGVWLPERDATWLVESALGLELIRHEGGALEALLQNLDAEIAPTADAARAFAETWSLRSEALAATLREGRARLAARPELLREAAGSTVSSLSEAVRHTPGLPEPGPRGAQARLQFDRLSPNLRTRVTFALVQANDALRARNAEASLTHYADAIAAAPEYFPPYALRATLLMELGELDAAINDISQAQSLAPRSPDVMQVVARLQLAQGDGIGALNTLDEALGVNPESPSLLADRGFVRLQLGHWSAAAIDFEAAAKLAPEDPNHVYNLGNARLQQGDFRGAIDAYDAALRLSPRDLQCLLNRGTAKSALDQFEGALADYEQAIAIEPLSTRSRLKRASLLMDMLHRPAEAYAEAFVVNALLRAMAPDMVDELDLAGSILQDAQAADEEILAQTACAAAVALLRRGARESALVLLDALDKAVPSVRARTQAMRGGILTN